MRAITSDQKASYIYVIYLAVSHSKELPKGQSSRYNALSAVHYGPMHYGAKHHVQKY
jgi:hypothetical protein